VKTTLVLCLFWSVTLFADIRVVDDSGTAVVLAEPAGKIVSLSPHLTELLFSLGVGDRIEATVDFSDYPEAALKIPRLGNAFSVSVEAVIEQSPDLIVAWMTGGNHRTFEQLRALGYPVFVNEASSLVDIAAAVQQLGVLVGKPRRGRELAEDFKVGLERLKQSNRDADSPKVFFQISDAQLYTVNSQHLIGQAIEICGAENIFSDVEFFVPMVSYESVVERNPDFLVVSSPYPEYKSVWNERWENLGWSGRVRTIDASLITRPSLRMLEGIKVLCETIGQ
jgi:iron complex transport system substrate-binding protein|tara:strand:+ start:6552 stop:7394 length:843 start_codon:yes stop_codon:yes gene_type:complete